MTESGFVCSNASGALALAGAVALAAHDDRSGLAQPPAVDPNTGALTFTGGLDVPQQVRLSRHRPGG